MTGSRSRSTSTVSSSGNAASMMLASEDIPSTNSRQGPSDDRSIQRIEHEATPLMIKRARGAAEAKPGSRPGGDKKTQGKCNNITQTSCPATPGPGEWTAWKREVATDRIIAAGYKALNLNALAAEVSGFFSPNGRWTPRSTLTSAEAP